MNKELSIMNKESSIVNEELSIAVEAIIKGLDLKESDELISINGNPLINQELSNFVETMYMMESNPFKKNGQESRIDDLTLFYEFLTTQNYFDLTIKNKVYLGNNVSNKEIPYLKKLVNLMNVGSIFYFEKKPQIHTPSYGLLPQKDLIKQSKIIYPEETPHIFKKTMEGKYQ